MKEILFHNEGDVLKELLVSTGKELSKLSVSPADDPGVDSIRNNPVFESFDYVKIPHMEEKLKRFVSSCKRLSSSHLLECEVSRYETRAEAVYRFRALSVFPAQSNVFRKLFELSDSIDISAEDGGTVKARLVLDLYRLVKK